MYLCMYIHMHMCVKCLYVCIYLSFHVCMRICKHKDDVNRLGGSYFRSVRGRSVGGEEAAETRHGAAGRRSRE